MCPRIHLTPIPCLCFSIPVCRNMLNDQFRAHLLCFIDGVEPLDSKFSSRIVDRDDRLPLCAYERYIVREAESDLFEFYLSISAFSAP